MAQQSVVSKPSIRCADTAFIRRVILLSNVGKCFDLLSNATKYFVMLLPVREQSGNIQQTATNGNKLQQKLVNVIMFKK